MAIKINTETLGRLANPNGAGYIINEDGRPSSILSGHPGIPVGQLIARVTLAQEYRDKLDAAIENTLVLINHTIES